MRKIFFGLLMTLLSFQAVAQDDDNKTITRLKIELGNYGYIRVENNFSLACPYNAVFFDIVSDSGKGHLSLFLAAKLASVAVSVTYAIDSETGNCKLSAAALD